MGYPAGIPCCFPRRDFQGAASEQSLLLDSVFQKAFICFKSSIKPFAAWYTVSSHISSINNKSKIFPYNTFLTGFFFFLTRFFLYKAILILMLNLSYAAKHPDISASYVLLFPSFISSQKALLSNCAAPR